MRNQQKSYSSNIYETSHMGSMQKAHCISLSIRLLVISLKFEPVHLHWLAGRAQASVSTIGRARHAALNIQLNRNRDRKGSSFTENARHQRTRVTRSDLPMHRRHLSGCLATLVCLLPTFVFSPSVSLSYLVSPKIIVLDLGFSWCSLCKSVSLLPLRLRTWSLF